MIFWNEAFVHLRSMTADQTLRLGWKSLQQLHSVNFKYYICIYFQYLIWLALEQKLPSHSVTWRLDCYGFIWNPTNLPCTANEVKMNYLITTKPYTVWVIWKSPLKQAKLSDQRWIIFANLCYSQPTRPICYRCKNWDCTRNFREKNCIPISAMTTVNIADDEMMTTRKWITMKSWR